MAVAGDPYSTQKWRKMRRRQLDAEPLCRACLAENKIEPAVVVDHVQPWRGNIAWFWYPPRGLQSLCRNCHESRKKYQEARGFDNAIGASGEPLDPGHPWFRGYQPKACG
jgi:5-methylcytosine-specific restriction enzyme A